MTAPLGISFDHVIEIACTQTIIISFGIVGLTLAV